MPSGPEFSAATAATLNRIATAANGEQGRNLRREFILRNKFTQGSLMMFKATAKPDADKINALVGSKSPYLDEQEAGGVAETKAGGPVKSIPSLQARGGSWSKPVGARFRRKRMGTIGHRGGGGRMTPKGAQFFWLSGKSLRTPTMFFRNATGLHKVFLSLKSRLQVKP